MLLFLMGVDIPSLLLLLILLITLGQLIFRLVRKLFRKTLKGASEKRIRVFSRVCAVVLPPVLLFGALALLDHASGASSIETSEEIVSSHYSLMEEDLAEELKVGMYRSEIVKMFGENDTTQSVMVYDLSVPNAEEKYILEISFEQGPLQMPRSAATGQLRSSTFRGL